MKTFLKHLLDFFKYMIKSLLIGIVTLFIFNFIGSYFNLNIPINIFTLLIVGILRIPGLVGIMIYTLI